MRLISRWYAHSNVLYAKKSKSWYIFNSLWSSDAMWWHTPRSTLVQVVDCCLTVPSHYLDPCWFIDGVLWQRYQFVKWVLKNTFQITTTFPRGQWVVFEQEVASQILYWCPIKYKCSALWDKRVDHMGYGNCFYICSRCKTRQEILIAYKFHTQVRPALFDKMVQSAGHILLFNLWGNRNKAKK